MKSLKIVNKMFSVFILLFKVAFKKQIEKKIKQYIHEKTNKIDVTNI
jgi:hypothetical protein